MTVSNIPLKGPDSTIIEKIDFSKFKADMDPHITLEQAVSLIREFEPILNGYGIHSALTGSVLYKGLSLKDFDIILYPRNPDTNSLKINDVRTILINIGFNPVLINGGSGMRFNKRTNVFSPSGGESNGKRVVDIYEYKGYRVDVFLDAYVDKKSLPSKPTVALIPDEDVPF